MYFKNSNGNNISIEQILIDGKDCNISGDYTGSIINIDVSYCLNNLSTKTPEVVVVTDDNIYSMKEYLKEIQISQSENGTSTLIINNLLLTSGPSSTYGSGVDDDSAKSVIVDSNGNIYVVGSTRSNLDFGNGISLTNDGDDDFYLVKYNNEGIAQFAKTSESGSGTGYDYANSVIVDSSGNIYVVGKTGSNLDFGNGINGISLTTDGYNDFYLVKYNNEGIAQFAKTSESGSGTGYDYANSVIVDSSGNIYVVGYTIYSSLDFGNGVSLTNDGGSDFYLVKYNSEGMPQLVKTSESGSGTPSKTEYKYDLAIDNNGNVYVLGCANGDLDFGNGDILTNSGYDDFFVYRYTNLTN